MNSSYHSHRRRKQARGTARLGIAGGVTGVVAVAAVGGVLVVKRGHGHEAEPVPRTMTGQTRSLDARPHVKPKTGDAFDVSTPDGFTYSLAAVKSGTSAHPFAGTRTRPPSGTTYAYIDYVITNTGTAPALLDFPADLFVRRSLVPESVLATNRCMPQPGAPEDMCTLPDTTNVVNTLGYPAPTTQDEDQYIPAGAGYLVRVASTLPVSPGVSQSDLGLYIWNPRFVPNRRAVKVAFP